MEVSKNSLTNKTSSTLNINSKNKNSLIKIKQDLKGIQKRKSILNEILNKNKKPIYLISQRNYKEKDTNNTKNPILSHRPINFNTKDIIMEKSLVKAFSHKTIEKKQNMNINPSKLSVNKKYEFIKNNLDMNKNIEINDYVNSNYLTGNNLNTNNFKNNNLNINGIVTSFSTKNKIVKRNSLKNLKNLSTYNKNKINSNNYVNNNINKSKYKNIIFSTNNSDFDNSNLNSFYFKNKNNKIINTNYINNNRISQNITDKNNNSINNISNNNTTHSCYNYKINYFNKPNNKSNYFKNNKNDINKLSKEIKNNENYSLLINSYNYKDTMKNCKSQGILKEINANKSNNEKRFNNFHLNASNLNNNIKYFDTNNSSKFIEENSNSLKNIILDNKLFFQNLQRNKTEKSNIKDKFKKNNFLTLNYNSKYDNNAQINTIYSKKKLKDNNINKNKNKKNGNLLTTLTTNNSSIFSPLVKVKNKNNNFFSNKHHPTNIINNSLSNNMDNKLNSLNININNFSNININNTISNYNSAASFNSLNNTINTLNENPQIIKRKIKKFLFKNNNKSSSVSNSNNIIILNNISMNNLNNIGYDYLAKLTKNSFKKNNFDKNIKKKIFSYVSKEKSRYGPKQNIKYEEYYNNQKKIHNKKNNNNNRINNENINFDSGFNIGLKNDSFIKKIKIKKNISNICKNNFKNKLKLNSITNNNNYYNHRHTFSNKLNSIIDVQKSNKNMINKKSKEILNTINHNNQTINQIIKDFKVKIKKNIKEKSLKINSAEISPNKNLNIYLSKQASKEKIKNNYLIKLSEENSIKIKQSKKQENINNIKNQNKLNIKKKFLKPKNLDTTKGNDKSNKIKITKEDSFIKNNELMNDPQYAYEYIVDILESLLNEEDYFHNKKNYIDPFYLENEESEITPEMRTVAVDWLVLIHHKIFKFKENTLFLAIQIFDRYLSKVIVDTDKAELLLLSSFMLASKHNEIDYVNMKEALQLVKNKFTKEEIINMEYEILNKINFEVLAPTMCEFFGIFANYLNLSNKKINEGLFILNIVLVDFHMLEYPNFMLALAVIKLITKNINNNLRVMIKNIFKKNNITGFNAVININDEQYEDIIILCSRIKLLYNTFLETKYKNIQEKFSESKYDSVYNGNNLI